MLILVLILATATSQDMAGPITNCPLIVEGSSWPNAIRVPGWNWASFKWRIA
jgi:hypothetical protein